MRHDQPRHRLNRPTPQRHLPPQPSLPKPNPKRLPHRLLRRPQLEKRDQPIPLPPHPLQLPRGEPPLSQPSHIPSPGLLEVDPNRPVVRRGDGDQALGVRDAHREPVDARPHALVVTEDRIVDERARERAQQTVGSAPRLITNRRQPDLDGTSHRPNVSRRGPQSSVVPALQIFGDLQEAAGFWLRSVTGCYVLSRRWRGRGTPGFSFRSSTPQGDPSWPCPGCLLVLPVAGFALRNRWRFLPRWRCR